MLFAAPFVFSLVSIIAAHYQKSDSCDQVHFLHQFTLETPPLRNGAKINCTYDLLGPSCSYYKLEAEKFELDSDCDKERLEIGDLDVLCGSGGGIRTYLAKNGSLRVRFISEGQNSRRSFVVRVTRLPCTVETTRQVDFGNYLPQCCRNIYNSAHFYLTSPGFPQTLQKADCRYAIYKSSPRMCRARVNIVYFNLDCANSFLQIENTRICGCHDDLKLMTTFDFSGLISMRFYNSHPGMGGFLLEITQERCPEKSMDRTKRSPDVRYYYFVAPEDGDQNFNREKDREETDYKDTSLTQYLNGVPSSYCQNPQYLIYRHPFLQYVPSCQVSNYLQASRKCVELDSYRGYFRSPGYPFYYPPNLDLCYSFRKRENVCSIKVWFADFQLENSQGCSKDYFVLDGEGKTCGTSLFDTAWTIDVRNKDTHEFSFVTDGYRCGRGFKGLYEQVLCYSNPDFPESHPAQDCSKIIQENRFLIEIHGNVTSCKYLIRKTELSVCKLHLDFPIFILDCDTEDLLINGKSYCRKGSTSLTLDFHEDITVVYQRSHTEPLITGLRLQIVGTQVTADCDPGQIPEVPAERISHAKNLDVSNSSRKAEMQEICELIKNITASLSSSKACEELLKIDIVDSCNVMNDTSIVTLQDNEFKIKKSQNQTEATVSSVDCDDYF